MNHRTLIKKAVSPIVPNEHNGFVPHLLKERSVWAILGVSVGLFLFSQVLHITNYFNLAAEVYPAAIVSLANHDRADALQLPLSTNTTLQAAAQLKANDMAANGYFAHTSPAGVTPWHWFDVAGYKFIYAGENLAVNFNESNAVETAWLNSPTHKANIMSPNYTEIGVATAEGVYKGSPTTFVVELFGMPAKPKSILAPAEAKPVEAVPAKQVATAPKAQVPEVRGESIETKKSPLELVTQDESFIGVKNTDTSLEQQPVVVTESSRVPWYDKIILNADTYIAIILQAVVVVLVLATAALVSREIQKHHRAHIAFGVLLTVILTSFLFIGRIGVFAEKPPQPTQTFSNVWDQ